MNGVEALGLSKAFGAAIVLDAIDARFGAGAFTSLLGPSGSGKTTLLRLIGGFLRPDAGRVLMDGEDVTDVPLWRRNIGMVFQSYALFPHLTVTDNVAYGLRRRGMRGATVRSEVSRVLELVHLTGFEDRRPNQLSGGQQQRVALARAIVTKPRVLLLDEPLSALDRKLRQGMQIELRRIQRESGLTTIFVTHDQEEALTLSDRIAILDGGRIAQEGTPAEVYERPSSLFAASFLGDVNVLRGRVVNAAIVVAGTPIRTAAPLPPDGDPVTLAVRPEKMVLGPAGVSATNAIAVHVRDVIYAGSSRTFLLDAADGLKLTALTRSRDEFQPAVGERATVSWSPDDAVVLDR